MDARVAARFFHVAPNKDSASDFPDLLMKIIGDDPNPADREQDLGHSVVFRLERCVEDKDFVAGEFCRKQTSNIPPQAGAAGLAPIKLADGHGLGHVGAFRYHKPTRILLLQSNRQCGSPRRVAQYLATAKTGALFKIEPVLREDALERFKDKRVRRLTIGFSSPTNLEALDDAGLPVARGVRLMAEAYRGVEVEITVSVGRKPKSYLQNSKILSSLRQLMSANADLKKLEVETSHLDGSDHIDFIQEYLRIEQDLDLPEGDPEKHYQVRNLYLKSGFSDNMSYISKLYGKK